MYPEIFLKLLWTFLFKFSQKLVPECTSGNPWAFNSPIISTEIQRIFFRYFSTNSSINFSNCYSRKISGDFYRSSYKKTHRGLSQSEKQSFNRFGFFPRNITRIPKVDFVSNSFRHVYMDSFTIIARKIFKHFSRDYLRNPWIPQ